VNKYYGQSEGESSSSASQSKNNRIPASLNELILFHPLVEKGNEFHPLVGKKVANSCCPTEGMIHLNTSDILIEGYFNFQSYVQERKRLKIAS